MGELPSDFMFPGGNPMSRQILSLSLSEVTDNWPLIRFLMDDPVYNKIYHSEMQQALYGCFEETVVVAQIRRLHELVRPYVVGAEGEINGYSYLTNGETEFDQALTDLLDHVGARQIAVQEYLQSVQ
jgi:hypothetical protein